MNKILFYSSDLAGSVVHWFSQPTGYLCNKTNIHTPICLWYTGSPACI